MKKRILSILLTLCMVMTLLPTAAFAISNKGEITANPATGAIYFGKTESGAPALYRVVAKTGDIVTLFYDGANIATAKMAYNNSGNPVTHQNWSGSDICGWLNGTAFLSNTSIFTSSETALIQTYGTTETTNVHANIDISQKIVLPSVEEVKVGGTWGMNDAARTATDTWWLRSPGTATYRAANVSGVNVQTDVYGVSWENGIRPVFKLNLTSMLFGSAATGGKTNTAGGVDSFSENTATALYLRFSCLADANISASDSVVTYTAPASSVLVAEVTSGGKTYVARKNIDAAVTTNTTFDLKTLTGLSDGVVTGNVWIEQMEDTTNSKGLIYAIAPFAVSYTVQSPNKKQAAPENLSGVAPTSASNNNGKIKGTKKGCMEYKLASAADSTYTTAGGDEISGLAAGKYVVRMIAGNGFNASDTTEVTVPKYVAASGTITVNHTTVDVNGSSDTSVVNFAGKEWYVIGANGEMGVATEAGTLTLLAKDNIEPNAKFHGTSNVYDTSDLKTAVETVYNGFTSGEKTAVATRTLEAGTYSASGPLLQWRCNNAGKC